MLTNSSFSGINSGKHKYVKLFAKMLYLCKQIKSLYLFNLLQLVFKAPFLHYNLGSGSGSGSSYILIARIGTGSPLFIKRSFSISLYTIVIFLRSKKQRSNPTIVLILFVLVTNILFTSLVLPINSLALLRWGTFRTFYNY